jgi:hypothetical protein
VPPAFADIHLEGMGAGEIPDPASVTVASFTIPEGIPAIAEVIFQGQIASYFSVQSLASDGSVNKSLIQHIGVRYEGTVLFDETPGQHSVAFEVVAEQGPWSITIQPATRAHRWNLPTLTGQGDDVAQIIPPFTEHRLGSVEFTGERIRIRGITRSGPYDLYDSGFFTGSERELEASLLFRPETYMLEVRAQGSGLAPDEGSTHRGEWTIELDP